MQLVVAASQQSAKYMLLWEGEDTGKHVCSCGASVLDNDNGGDVGSGGSGWSAIELVTCAERSKTCFSPSRGAFKRTEDLSSLGMIFLPFIDD